MKKEKKYTVSSGNIFADLGASDPEKKLAKAEIASQINTLIKEKNLTQERAAILLEVDQSKISLLNKGKLSGFSLERLFRFLNALDQKITITITPKTRFNTRKTDVIVTLQKTKKICLPIPKTTSNPKTVSASKKRK